MDRFSPTRLKLFTPARAGSAQVARQRLQRDLRPRPVAPQPARSTAPARTYEIEADERHATLLHTLLARETTC